jgi:hypothetical protein
LGLRRLRRAFVLAVVFGVVIVSTLLYVVSAFSVSLDFGAITFSDSNSTISFAVPPGAELSYLQLRVESTGARAEISLPPFCSTHFCSVPMVLGGSVFISLRYGRQDVFSERLSLPALGMNCTSEAWTNRICHFRNLTYTGDKYYLLSPYHLDFDDALLCLGSKTPPVDFEPNRLIGVFETDAYPNRKSRRITAASHLVSIYYNLGKLWHQNFDFILPLFLTMSLSGAFDPGKIVFVPQPWFDSVPKLAAALSNYPLQPLKGQVTWDDVTLGMVKLTDLRQDRTDPPYSFPANCTGPLRRRVLEYLNLTAPGWPAFVFLRRKGSLRSINNENEFGEFLSGLTKDLEFIDVHFEGTTPEFQVEMLARAKVFVSIHGSGLANLLWMDSGALVVEIVGPVFRHHYWYRMACKAAGLRHYIFEGDPVAGEVDPPELRDCKRNGADRVHQPCSDLLRDQSVHIDIGRFEKELGQLTFASAVHEGKCIEYRICHLPVGHVRCSEVIHIII